MAVILDEEEGVNLAWRVQVHYKFGGILGSNYENWSCTVQDPYKVLYHRRRHL
jgi:hypothetical protein